MELKRIDFEKKEFKANGVTYYIQTEGISVGRFMHYERFVQIATFGTDFMGMFETLKRIFLAATSGVDVLKALKDIGDLSYNQMAVIKEQNELKKNNVLMLATLFINRTDENLAEWDERIANDKINDWVQEGIAMHDFFLLAMSQIEGFRDAYLNPLIEAVAGKKRKQEPQKLKFEIQDYAKTWTDNLKLARANRQLKPVSIKKLTGMDETLDEMMILVSRETNYVLADLEKMEIIRFLRIVESVKRLVKASTTQEETKKAEGEAARRRSMK